jgi:uncharacterized membrane protein SirB2
MGSHYLQLRLAHVIFVSCSGGLFALRGVLALNRSPAANHPALRWLSYVIDTGLLASALMLVAILHQYPFMDAWLTTKVLLLLPYIVLGSYALRRARSQRGRAAAFIAALLVFLYIASVAYWHDPAGIFHRPVTWQPR